MKKVIGNKLYDTEKAERIGSDSFSVVGDFHYWFQELYRTRSARFFLRRRRPYDRLRGKLWKRDYLRE